eukprot:366156-Chlamydomonas_euryale.AAC.4
MTAQLTFLGSILTLSSFGNFICAMRRFSLMCKHVKESGVGTHEHALRALVTEAGILSRRHASESPSCSHVRLFTHSKTAEAASSCRGSPPEPAGRLARTTSPSGGRPALKRAEGRSVAGGSACDRRALTEGLATHRPSERSSNARRRPGYRATATEARRRQSTCWEGR